jgi:O-methyltransferase
VESTRRLLGWIVDSVSARIVGRCLFDVDGRERLHRREFFFNAFKVLRFNGIDGDYTEFGSSGGTTFAFAYRESRRYQLDVKLWAFDSFQGLPAPEESDEHPRWVAGKMARGVDEFRKICAKNGIPAGAYELVPGFYDETLTAMTPDDEPTNIALAYVDCDLYSSTKTVLRFLRPRMKHGMVVAFDDYFCWSSTQMSGERKAMLEFIAGDDRWEWVPYIQFGWHGQSFVIEDKALTRPRDTGAATLDPPPT